jgi:RHS repeat-associated protein
LIKKDYLGSWYAVTDATGRIVNFHDAEQRYNFDPWGRRRNALSWEYEDTPTSFLFDRGYTGHEHLDAFGLINMNGRVYDPVIARFLSVDPFVQAPFTNQCYNRYSYCVNNPFRYTDPSGYLTLPDFEFILSCLLGSEYGGSWSPNVGMQLYSSNSQAIEGGVNALNNAADAAGWHYASAPEGYKIQSGMRIKVEGWKSLFGTTSVSRNSAVFFPPMKVPILTTETFTECIPVNAVQYEGPQGGGGWYDNAGVYITGAVLTVEDVYNNFYHNHTTYTTTGGVTKNIYKANGTVRSARAAQFATTSTAIKIAGTAGTALMTAQAGTKIYNGSATAWDYGDFMVGSVGTVAGAAELIGGASYAVPGVGEAVAAYAWFRLWFDLGAQYGPSKWYGNDDTRWFK